MYELYFTDSEDLEELILDAEIISDESTFVDSSKSKNSVWLVATHSDMVINKRIYTPNALKAGAHTFVKPFKKPVLVHHDEKTDAIGRVQESYYFEKEDWGAAERLVGKNHIDFPDKASGAIVLRATISDREAWEKVQDERYKSVSIGFTSGAAYCNICGTNWADGKCKHTPGKKYGKETMYLILEDMHFKEISFINTPADDYAVAINSTTDPDDAGITNSDNNDVEYGIEDNITPENKNTREDRYMDFEQKYSDLLSKYTNLEKIYKKDTAKEIFEIKAALNVKGFDEESKESAMSKYMDLDVETLELLKDEIASIGAAYKSMQDSEAAKLDELKKKLEDEYESKLKEITEKSESEDPKTEDAEAEDAKEPEAEPESKTEEPAEDKPEDSAEDKPEDTDEPEASKEEKTDNADANSEKDSENLDKPEEKTDTEVDGKDSSNIHVDDPNDVISKTSSDRPSETPKEKALKQLRISR